MRGIFAWLAQLFSLLLLAVGVDYSSASYPLLDKIKNLPRESFTPIAPEELSSLPDRCIMNLGKSLPWLYDGAHEMEKVKFVICLTKPVVLSYDHKAEGSSGTSSAARLLISFETSSLPLNRDAVKAEVKRHVLDKLRYLAYFHSTATAMASSSYERAFELNYEMWKMLEPTRGMYPLAKNLHKDLGSVTELCQRALMEAYYGKLAIGLDSSHLNETNFQEWMSYFDGTITLEPEQNELVIRTKHVATMTGAAYLSPSSPIHAFIASVKLRAQAIWLRKQADPRESGIRVAQYVWDSQLGLLATAALKSTTSTALARLCEEKILDLMRKMHNLSELLKEQNKSAKEALKLFVDTGISGNNPTFPLGWEMLLPYSDPFDSLMRAIGGIVTINKDVEQLSTHFDEALLTTQLHPYPAFLPHFEGVKSDLEKCTQGAEFCVGRVAGSLLNLQLRCMVARVAAMGPESSEEELGGYERAYVEVAEAVRLKSAWEADNTIRIRVKIRYANPNLSPVVRDYDTVLLSYGAQPLPSGWEVLLTRDFYGSSVYQEFMLFFNKSMNIDAEDGKLSIYLDENPGSSYPSSSSVSSTLFLPFAAHIREIACECIRCLEEKGSRATASHPSVLLCGLAVAEALLDAQLRYLAHLSNHLLAQPYALMPQWESTVDDFDMVYARKRSIDTMKNGGGGGAVRLHLKISEADELGGWGKKIIRDHPSPPPT